MDSSAGDVPLFSAKTTVDDMMNCKKCVLQAYLKCHREKCSGTKAELAEKAYRCNLEQVEQRQHLTGSPEERTKPTKQTCSINDLPYIADLKAGWTSECSIFPAVSHKDVEHYSIKSSHRTGDMKQMECYRQFIRGFNFFKEGYVHKIMINPIDENCPQCYIRSKCFPSMKQGCYTQFILATKNEPFEVLKANCSCPAGLGEGCTHIAGLLFALEEMDTKGGDVASTSKPCEWNKPTKRSREIKPVEDIDFKRIRYNVEESNTKRRKRDVRLKENSITFIESLCAKLKTTNAVVFDLLPPVENGDLDVGICSDINVAWSEEVQTSQHIVFQSDSYMNVLNLRELVSKENFIQFIRDLPDCLIKEIEERTRGQNENPLWMETRKGRVTPSIFHDVKTRKFTTPPEKLLDTILGNKAELLSVPAVDWGRKNEMIAKKRYQAYKKLKCKRNIAVKNCGIFVCSSCGYLGASPDGVVEIDGYKSHLIEIKCPYKWRNGTVLEACHSDNFYCYVDSNGEIRLKNNHRYYTQIQGQMAICKFNKCDLVIYTKRDMKIVEIMFDSEFWDFLFNKLRAFYTNYVVSALYK